MLEAGLASSRFLPGSPKPLGPKDVVGFRDGDLKGINEVTRVGPEPEGLGPLGRGNLDRHTQRDKHP